MLKTDLYSAIKSEDSEALILQGSKGEIWLHFSTPLVFMPPSFLNSATYRFHGILMFSPNLAQLVHPFWVVDPGNPLP